MGGGVVTLRIRPLVPDDLDAVVALEAATYPQPWSRRVFEEELAAPGRRYIVAVDEGSDGRERILGYGGLMLVPPEAHVTTVAVAEEARGRRLGTRLMLDLVEQAIAAGARQLTLEVRVSNRPAQALYRRFGLAPVGVRKHYYRDEDALIMWAHDIHEPPYQERLDEIRRSLGAGPDDEMGTR